MPNVSAIDELLETTLPHNQTTLYDIDDVNDKDDESAPQVGLSKSSLKTIELLATQFKENDTVQFGDVTEDIARSDVCRFFFELLVLKTRDLVQVVQQEAFGEIEVTARPSFFEQQQ